MCSRGRTYIYITGPPVEIYVWNYSFSFFVLKNCSKINNLEMCIPGLSFNNMAKVPTWLSTYNHRCLQSELSWSSNNMIYGTQAVPKLFVFQICQNTWCWSSSHVVLLNPSGIIIFAISINQTIGEISYVNARRIVWPTHDGTPPILINDYLRHLRLQHVSDTTHGKAEILPLH